MFVRVIEGRIRFVIVNRAVVLVMVVVDALIVLQLMETASATGGKLPCMAKTYMGKHSSRRM